MVQTTCSGVQRDHITDDIFSHVICSQYKIHFLSNLHNTECNLINDSVEQKLHCEISFSLSLLTGSFWDPQSSQTLCLGSPSGPVTKMVPVAGKLWCGCQNRILIINTSTLTQEVSESDGPHHCPLSTDRNVLKLFSCFVWFIALVLSVTGRPVECNCPAFWKGQPSSLPCQTWMVSGILQELVSHPRAYNVQEDEVWELVAVVLAGVKWIWPELEKKIR